VHWHREGARFVSEPMPAAGERSHVIEDSVNEHLARLTHRVPACGAELRRRRPQRLPALLAQRPVHRDPVVVERAKVRFA
jgi:hypothetical protein